MSKLFGYDPKFCKMNIFFMPNIKKDIFGIVFFVSMIFSSSVYAQTISYSSNVALSVVKESDLSFGMVYQNQGNVSVLLGDLGVGKFRIDGQKNLDVTVTLTMPASLVNTSDANYTIPYTAQVAYANKGQDNQQQANPFSLPTQTFRIEGRDSGPPQPPPTPQHGTYTGPQGSAWIYLYGTINVQNVKTGTYQGTVSITVTYN